MAHGRCQVQEAPALGTIQHIRPTLCNMIVSLSDPGSHGISDLHLVHFGTFSALWKHPSLHWAVLPKSHDVHTIQQTGCLHYKATTQQISR